MKVMNFTKKKVVALGLAGGLAAGFGGIAAAYFTAGNGTGHAQVANVAMVHFTGSTGLITPTGTGTNATMTFTVTNPNGQSVKITSATATVQKNATGFVLNAKKSNAAATNCYARWFSATPTHTSGTIAAGGHYTTTVTVHMTTNGPQTACEGVAPLVKLSVAIN